MMKVIPLGLVSTCVILLVCFAMEGDASGVLRAQEMSVVRGGCGHCLHEFECGAAHPAKNCGPVQHGFNCESDDDCNQETYVRTTTENDGCNSVNPARPLCEKEEKEPCGNTWNCTCRPLVDKCGNTEHVGSCGYYNPADPPCPPD